MSLFYNDAGAKPLTKRLTSYVVTNRCANVTLFVTHILPANKMKAKKMCPASDGMGSTPVGVTRNDILPFRIDVLCRW
jgi:hypothetical protein